MCKYVPFVCFMTVEVRKGYWIPRNWSYRWLWAAMLVQELNVGPLQDQQMLLITDHLSSPWVSFVATLLPSDGHY